MLDLCVGGGVVLNSLKMLFCETPENSTLPEVVGKKHNFIQLFILYIPLIPLQVLGISAMTSRSTAD